MGRPAAWRAFGVLGISRLVSATRPPARFPEHERQPREPQAHADLDELEELGDEAIISQQTAAHAPQPRANVSEESRSVVISEQASRHDTEPPRNPPPRSSAEATLVIRDRRALDEMRRKIVRGQRKHAQRHSALYLWGGLGLAAFVLGGIVAFLATETRSDAQTADNQGPGPRADVQPLPSALAAKAGANGAPASPPRPVRLDDLPVESARKH